MKLFIADDSKVLRDRLSDMISEIEGISIVGEAEDSIAALAAVERLKPDVIILDIKMPGGDGFLALDVLKRGKKPPKVIVFTNHPYLQYRKRSLDIGADFFFYKATEFDILIDLLKNLVKAY